MLVTAFESRKFCQLLADRTGLNIPDDRIDQVGEALAELIPETEQRDFESFYQTFANLSAYDRRFQRILERVTIGETFFFRDTDQFQALRTQVLPQLLQQASQGRMINILCAACSTGEEPYSLAILLHELIHDPALWRRINLVAGDINISSLNRALRGCYTKWSFRGVSNRDRDRYFAPQGDQFQLIEDIRCRVKFQYLNLAEELPFIDLDLVLMRNVLIYFSSDFIKRLSERVARALRPEGWLIVGANEFNRSYFSQFDEVPLCDTLLYRKPTNNPIQPAPTFNTSRATTKLDLSLLPKPELKLLPPQPAKPLLPAQPDQYPEAERLFQFNRLSEAEQILKKLIDSDPRALLLMAKISANRGQYQQSENYCRRYLSKSPDSLDAHYLLGLIHQSENRMSAAAESFRYAIFLDRNFAMGHWNLANVYQQLADKQAARRHLLILKKLLGQTGGEQLLSHSEGQTAARMLQIVEMMLQGYRE